MPAWILLMAFLLVPALAGAEDPLRSSALAPGESMDASFTRALDARVGDIVDRRVALAAERAVAALEDREAERLGEMPRAAARRAEPALTVARVRRAPRGVLAGELTIVRVSAPASAEGSR